LLRATALSPLKRGTNQAEPNAANGSKRIVGTDDVCNPETEVRMNFVPPVMGYVGPESFLPLASVMSAVVGVALLFGKRLQLLSAAAWQRIRNDRSRF
jgi:hypothetical protein